MFVCVAQGTLFHFFPIMIVINASEVAALCGLNPYKNKDEAIQDMLNRNNRMPSTETIRTNEICKDKEFNKLNQTISKNSENTNNVKDVSKLKYKLHQDVSEIEKTKLSEVSAKFVGAMTRSRTKEKEQQEAKVKQDCEHMKRSLTSKVNTSFGTRKETNVADIYKEHTGIEIQKDNKAHYWQFAPNAKVVGRFDGFTKDGVVLIEIKNRMRRLFGTVPEYERVQVHVYMKMAGVKHAQLVEGHDGKIQIHDVRMNRDFMDDIEAELLHIVSNI